MLRDSDAACVAMALCLCWEEKRNSRWNKGWYKQRSQNTHSNIKTGLILSEAHHRNFSAVKWSIILRATHDCYLTTANTNINI
jgi:hypothetical protein